MMDRAARWMVVVLGLVLVGLGVWGEEGLVGWERFVAPALAGEGDGWVGFPAAFEGERAVEVLDPAGFAFHLTSADDPGEERVVPAGQAFQPQPGSQRLWMQGEWSMSPFTQLVVVARRPMERRSPRFFPLAPAGRVTVDETLTLPGLELWVLDVSHEPIGGGHELSRRRPIAEAAAGVLMPAGPVLAALWDRRGERWVALSTPFQVPARQWVEAPLQRPAEGVAQLFAYVTEEEWEPASVTHADVVLAVKREGRSFEPDFTFATDWGLYAVWYSLPPGPAVLSGGNGRLYLERQAMELAGGEITRFDGAFTRRPILDVNLLLPSVLREEPFTLAVRRLPDRELLAEVEPPRRSGQHRFGELEQARVEIRLETHLGPFRRQVDLAGKLEESVILEPEVIEVIGIVRHGGEPAPARLEWLTDARDELVARAGDDGAYRLRALQPLRFISVDLDSTEQAPWTDIYMPPIEESRELDFDIPDAEVTVRVVDGRSGAPVPGARLAVRNVFVQAAEGEATAAAAPVESPESQPPGDGARPAPAAMERVLAHTYAADEAGVALLPPPRRGRLELTAHADDYQPQREPRLVEIDDPEADRELELVLQPFGERRTLRLAWPDGTPAAGAQVYRLDALTAPQVLFSGRADAEGVVRVPMEPETGWLLLNPTPPGAGSPSAASGGSGAAFGLIAWERWRGRSEADWTFPPAADEVLAVRVVDPGGEAAVRHAEVALRVDGRTLSGPVLTLLGIRSRSDGNGYFIAQGLPRAPVGVLAVARGQWEALAAGTLDNLATEVPWPWPTEVEVFEVR